LQYFYKGHMMLNIKKSAALITILLSITTAHAHRGGAGNLKADKTAHPTEIVLSHRTNSLLA